MHNPSRGSNPSPDAAPLGRAIGLCMALTLLGACTRTAPPLDRLTPRDRFTDPARHTAEAEAETKASQADGGSTIVPAAILPLPTPQLLPTPDKPAVEPPPDFTEWRPLFKAVDYRRGAVASPQRVVIHVVRVRLEVDGVAVFVTPPAVDRADGGFEVRSARPSSVLEKHGLQVVINGSPYGPVVLREGQPQEILGTCISNGTRYSQPRPGWGVLANSPDGRAAIFEQPGRGEWADLIKRAESAIGGFGIVLKDGRIVGGDADRHPRTAVGVSPDGRTLFLLVADGRQPGYSRGATTAELGRWLRELGADDGLNLDGGGSSALVIEGHDGRPRVVNRPIHLGIPGIERPIANHLGIYARPLP